MESKHSPLPWRVDNKFNRHQRIEVWDAKRLGDIGLTAMVAEVIDDRPRDGRANAEYIVRAANSLPDLLKGAKYLRNAITAASFDLDAVVKNTAELLHIADAVQQIDRAIAKAEAPTHHG